MRIPSYNGPQVNEEPLRAQRLPTDAPLDAFGGGQTAANAFNATGDVAGNIQQRATQEYIKQREDAVNQQAMEMSSKITQEETRLKTEFMNLSGPDALKASNEVNGNLEKFYQKLEKDIPDDDVKRLVNRHYLGTQNQLGAWAQHTAGVKMRQYDAEQFDSEGKTLLDSVSVDPSPGNVASAALGRKLAIEQFASRNGLSPEWVKAQQDGQASKIHFMALNSLATSGQSLAAKNFFEMNKADFVGEDLVRAQRIVEDGSRLGVAYNVADAVFAKQQDTITAAKDAAKQLAGAQYDDPETRKAIDQQVEHRWNQQKLDQKITLDKTFEDAARVVEQTGSTASIDRNVWLNVLTNEDRVRLDSRAANKAKPPRVEDDPKAYIDWKSIPDDVKAAMSKRDFYGIADTGAFTTKTLEKMTDEWEGLRRKEDRVSFKFTHDDSERVFNAMKEAGLADLTGKENLRTLTGDKLKNTAEFMKRAEDAFKVAYRKNGKNPDLEEKETIISNLIKDEGIADLIKPHWYSYVNPFLESATTTYMAAPVPEDQRNAILQQYPKASETKIRLLYQARKRGMTPAGVASLAEQYE